MLQPKYVVGQTVFVACSAYTEVQVQCPDCKGTKEWSVTTPAGETFDIPCGTCHGGWYSEGTVNVYKDHPQVRTMTVGSIRIDTADLDNPVEYMMHETGVGTGSIYSERNVFDNYDAALLTATFDARHMGEARQKRLDEEAARNKKRYRSKPSWEKRRIKELEKQLAAQSKTTSTP